MPVSISILPLYRSLSERISAMYSGIFSSKSISDTTSWSSWSVKNMVSIPRAMAFSICSGGGVSLSPEKYE